MYERRPDAVNQIGPNLLASTYQCDEGNELGVAFFGPSNMAKIQAGLRDVILTKTGYLIGRQSDEEVGFIMRSVYLDHARHGGLVAQELERLNAIVLSILVPMVATGISQYMGYLRDASRLPAPINRPQNLSIKGRNTLEMFRGM